MKKLDLIQDLLHAAKGDSEKFEKGNKAAGTRLRGAMQQIKTLAQEIRQEVSKAKNKGE